ncbi:MAG: hypothetical protein NC217_06900 [Muribaculaceae bacterium]|nr:hypothetical protein [Muribaculaceae bacterium]
MLTSYTESSLIAHYRQIHGISATYNDESDNNFNALLRQRLRSWYANLLLTAPAERLPTRDLRTRIERARLIPNGMMITLPQEGARLVSVKAPEWAAPITTFHSIGSPAHLRQRNYWLQSTPDDPVGVLDGDILYIYGIATHTSANPLTNLEYLIMTAAPEDGTYQFDDADYPEI